MQVRQALPTDGQGLIARKVGSGSVGPLDLSIGHGACLCVAGRSGAGKSTLLRILADLVPHTGEVWLDGQAQSDMAAPLWRRSVTYVAPDSAWWAPRVRDHFQGDATHFSDRLRLPRDLLDAAPDRLSTGERQRLALIRALLGKPAVLLLDEPSAALDSDAVLRVENLLGEFLSEGGILVLVSHDDAQIQRMATDTLVLERVPA
ncbi:MULTISPECIES: ABC transporter ATP-binding protein [Paracoccus]|uniref:ABC transporter ATP-binding protein n=1 Tax=Paracoccus TaxID=265 RepID=UPI001F0A4A4F|nr:MULTISPECIES: ABC transporter ATP-binding protein [Paracoccus]MCJ1902136.1 ABC transporter ATP-binding protein [Paracoccus versutus]MDF3906840.1 ABC transporter ATP-binding protein [Paracoccus sp. AS002]